MKKESGKIILGKKGNEYVFSDDEKHVLICGPSGSGKGVSFVIPNLLNWTDSAVVHDITGENFKKTSGWRKKQGQKVYLWNPGTKNGQSHRYNPLDLITDDENEMPAQIAKIAQLILPENEFWTNEARGLLRGFLLYIKSCGVKYQGKVHEKMNFTFTEVVQLLKSDDAVYNIAVLMDQNGTRMHPIAYIEMAHFLQKASDERSTILSFLNSALSFWGNPIIEALTETSDFDLRKIRKEKSTIYICIDPDEIKRLKPLIDMFYIQLVDVLCDNNSANKESVLIIVDDFITLGEQYNFDFNINFLRNYNVRLCSVFQNYEQIKKLYATNASTFLANSGYKLVFSTNDGETQQAFSGISFYPDGKNLPAHEFALLERKKEIMISEAEGTFILDKIYYYKDNDFKDKILPPAKIPKQKFKRYGKTKATRIDGKNNVSYLKLAYDAGKKDGDDKKD